jgi:hypothetical protein
MKMAGTGATFSSTPGAQRVLETSLFVDLQPTIYTVFVGTFMIYPIPEPENGHCKNK